MVWTFTLMDLLLKWRLSNTAHLLAFSIHSFLARRASKCHYNNPKWMQMQTDIHSIPASAWTGLPTGQSVQLPQGLRGHKGHILFICDHFNCKFVLRMCTTNNCLFEELRPLGWWGSFFIIIMSPRGLFSSYCLHMQTWISQHVQLEQTTFWAPCE